MEKRQTKKEILPDKSRRVGDLLFPDKPLWSMANMDIGPTLDPPLSQPTEYLVKTKFRFCILVMHLLYGPIFKSPVVETDSDFAFQWRRTSCQQGRFHFHFHQKAGGGNSPGKRELSCNFASALLPSSSYKVALIISFFAKLLLLIFFYAIFLKCDQLTFSMFDKIAKPIWHFVNIFWGANLNHILVEILQRNSMCSFTGNVACYIICKCPLLDGLLKPVLEDQ